ncbi:MAG: transposase [Phycisphaerales bacterium]|nr:transposase [Phycisphaerales bacterium]MCB9854774.1 transposase [Phycisphaerales bacterium]MCB9863754.1 transposase [Phycisphaerales bacterium]
MRTRLGHRKLVTHDDAAGEAHELTFSCYRRLQLLRLNSRCELLAEAVDRAMDTQRYELIAYVFMPEHVHLLVLPLDGATGIAKLLFAIKRPFSFRVKKRMAADADPMLSELTIRDRPNHTSFRFWQEGPGYDRNIRKESTLRKAIDDIHRNPVRRGLVDETSKWKWSSWHAYDEETSKAPTRPRVSMWC